MLRGTWLDGRGTPCWRTIGNKWQPNENGSSFPGVRAEYFTSRQLPCASHPRLCGKYFLARGLGAHAPAGAHIPVGRVHRPCGPLWPLADPHLNE